MPPGNASKAPPAKLVSGPAAPAGTIRTAASSPPPRTGPPPSRPTASAPARAHKGESAPVRTNVPTPRQTAARYTFPTGGRTILSPQEQRQLFSPLGGTTPHLTP